MKRAQNLAYWTVPPLLCLALYWPGLWAWFQQDDLAWLGLGASVQDVPTLLRALFEPMAQGTIRPLSERAFFLVFYSIFGLWATPFRAAVFLTQFANLVLLGLLVQRVTRSRLAGFLAPSLWALNGGLAMAMSWTAAYNQVLCGFFLLLALYCFVRHTENGDRRFFTAQWIVFLLGFGVLEINAVYPALAAAYALCCARPYLRKTGPMFLVSGAYALLHFWVAPVHTAGPAYLGHFDASMLGTLWTYWQWALGPTRLVLSGGKIPSWAGVAGTVLLTAPLAGFLAWKLWRRQWPVLLPLAWFVIVLLPVLPLRDHISSYYLTVPTAGLAWLAAWALESAFHQRWYLKGLALALAAVYLTAGIVGGRIETRVMVQRSHAIRTLVWGAVRVRELHPNNAIVLAGLDSDLFWAGVFHRPFRLVGIPDVYVAPEAVSQIQPRPELGNVSDFVIPPAILMDLLAKHRAVVYTPDADRLRAITLSYLAGARLRWDLEEPRRVDAGLPSFAGQLGPTWYKLETGHRWMPRRATVRLGGPRTAAAKLHVSGYCPAAQVVGRSLRVSVGVERKPLQVFRLSQGDSQFHLVLNLPPELVGKQRVEVYVEVDRTFTNPPDRRELGLSFGAFEIRE
jgi:hypothetical protein